jgi:MFS family permease
MPLRPDSVVTPADLDHGIRALIRDGGWANVGSVLSGGVVLVGLAVSLDASPLVIGLLAAIPFCSQLAQLPAIALIERVRQRRKISVLTITAARVVVLGLAAVPLLANTDLALVMLVVGQAAVACLGAVGACAWNSWMHDLLPRAALGSVFARRLLWATGLAMIAGLAIGVLIDHWRWGKPVYGYSISFLLSALAGFISSYWLAQVPEPIMEQAAARASLTDIVGRPFRDSNFRQLIRFMSAWNFAVNLSAPFITVYFMQQLQLGLGGVTWLWAMSQCANLASVNIWGRLSDRLSNKAILAVSAPLYFGAVMALPFTATPAPHSLTLPLLVVIHLLTGAATAGTGLATGAIGLKLAREGDATAYLAAVSLAGSLAAGVAPLIGGALANWFGSRELALVIHWTGPSGVIELMAMRLHHWEFLFAISFLLGLYALHRLALVTEDGDVSDRRVVQQFLMESRRSMRNLSSVVGLRTSVAFPFGRLVQRLQRQQGIETDAERGRSAGRRLAGEGRPFRSGSDEVSAYAADRCKHQEDEKSNTHDSPGP